MSGLKFISQTAFSTLCTSQVFFFLAIWDFPKSSQHTCTVCKSHLFSIQTDEKTDCKKNAGLGAKKENFGVGNALMCAFIHVLKRMTQIHCLWNYINPPPFFFFLKCFNRNYEHIVKAHQNNPQQGEDQVSDQVKFNIFQSIMDSLFQSFSNSVSVSSFQELSACVFSWIEEHCKPQVRSMFKKPMRTLLFCVCWGIYSLFSAYVLS